MCNPNHSNNSTDQLSPAVADLGPAKPKLVDTSIERNIPQNCPKYKCLHILWGYQDSD